MAHLSDGIVIRPYEGGDHPDMITILCATASESYRSSESRRKALEPLFLDYYINEEKENCFVAVSAGHVVGYVISSVDFAKYRKAMKNKYLPLAKELCKPLYKDGRNIMLTLRLISRHYPNHLHIDILPSFQKQGIGHRLLSALGDRYLSIGVPCLVVCPILKGSGPESYYTHFGFRKAMSFPFGYGAYAYKIPTSEEK